MTDAWHPAVNGVIRTIESLTRELEAMGHQVLVIGTDRFRTLPLPSYPEIRLAWNAWRLPAMIDAFAPDSIHIATEGPLGLAAGAIACGASGPSRPPSTRAFPNMWRAACRCLWPGAMHRCAGFTPPPQP